MTALSVLLSVVALVGPITTASANHPGGAVLDCTPEQAANPTTGTAGGAQNTGNRHTVTCTLEDPNTGNPVQANNGPVAIDFEIDCFSGCGDAAYTTTTANPTTNQATVSPTAPEAGDDGDDAVGTNDDIRQSSVEMTCVISAGTSSCTVTYQRTDAATGGPGAGDIDLVAAWIDHDGSDATDESDGAETPGGEDSDNTDVVQKNWEVRQAQNVNCGPDETNQTGDTHTVNCTTTDQFGQAVDNNGANNQVLFTQTGGNTTGTNTCATTTQDPNAQGQTSCTFTNNGTPGQNVTTACVDRNGNGTCDAGEPTDSQTKTFQAGAASGVDATPENDTNTVGDQHTVTCTLFNQFGNQNNNQGTTDTVCNFEFFTGSPSDQDGNTVTSPDRSCTTPNNANTCTITYFSNAPGTDLICVYLGTDEVLAGNNQGGTCDGEGLTDATADNGTPNPANDDQDVVQKTWQAAAGPATQVNAEPEDDTNPVGSQHIIRVFAGSANNQPTTSTPIRADILPGSANQQNQTQAEITCTADATNEAGNANTFPGGQTQTHECAYTGANAGIDQVMVFADTNGNNIFDQGEPSDQVRKVWSGAAFALAMTDGDTAAAGTCNEFTVTVTDANGNPVAGQIVDVQQVLQGAGNEPGETRELAFCDPTTGPNPTGQGGTQFGDVQNNPTGPGQPGAQTTVHAEVGPTNNQGQVTFGITINDVPQGQTATVNVRSWVDVGGDNDAFNAGEPTDTAVKTWTPGGAGSVTALNAEPESATNPIGTSHQVTVTLTGANGQGIPGVTPNSIIANNAQGRPAGDVANPNAGTSPNAAPGNFTAYTCTASNAQGVSTCTFADPGQPGPTGTDTIVFYVNQANQSGGGTPGPDASEPQDAVQKTWVPGPQNLSLDLRCAGMGTQDDQDVGENPNVVATDPAGTPDCTNPLSDTDEVFTAIVTNAQNVGQANIRVDFSFGQRNPNNSTSDATLNATGGGQIGTNPNTLRTFCITDATGRCTVTLANATPQAGDTIEVVGTISGASGGTPTDAATKQWQSSVVNQGGTITLTPAAATNQVGTPHTVTATVRNQFGQPVQGANVDFRITNGPNAGLAQAGMLDAVTDANGNATFTYTSNATGTDTILACSETGGTENDTCNQGTGNNLNQGAGGEPNATATKTWQTGPVTTNAVGLDMDADDAATVNPANPGGCELASASDPNRETSATNQVDPTPGGALAAGNFHRVCAAAFQTNQVGNQGRIAGATITFTITGPGRIYAANANGNCNTNAAPAAGTTVTATADGAGFAFACLYSQQVGRTTVTATSGTPAQTATGTKDWTVSPNTARFIQLCHGDLAGTTCETAAATNEPGDEHQFTARVTDAQGNPVANVPVQFRETGPAIFTPQGGSSATVNTDANGLASVLITSDVEGQSTVVAEIDPAGQAAPGGTVRQPGAGNDQCEAPAGTNNQPAAGNCVSQSLTKNWTEPEPEFQCNDGVDNDNDGNIDFPEDQACESEVDNSEFPPDEPPPPTEVRHDRTISIRFQDGTGARNNGLVVFGRVRVADGFNDCRAAQPVNVQRRVGDRWVTKKTTTTNRKGRYAVEIFDQASRYRAIAPRTEILDEDLNELHVCRKAFKAKRHRHRR